MAIVFFALALLFAGWCAVVLFRDERERFEARRRRDRLPTIGQLQLVNAQADRLLTEQGEVLLQDLQRQGIEASVHLNGEKVILSEALTQQGTGKPASGRREATGRTS